VKFLLTLAVSFFFLFSSAQTYSDEVKLAGKAYDEGKFDSCAFFFKKAFAFAHASGNDLYNAATCNVLCSHHKKAFSLLFDAIKNGINISKLKIDPDMDILHSSARWKKLVRKANAIQSDSFQVCAYPQYARRLAAIWEDDQYWRFRLGNAFKNGDTAAQKKLWAQMRIADSVNNNVKKLEAIIDSIGWPTRSKVGRWGAMTAFLVFDHAPREVMEKYFPFLEKAANEGEASKSNMATMKDRILVNRGKKQIYGTQSHWDDKQNKSVLFPIEDPQAVNRLRKEVGLEPLEGFPINE
jgi:hypothetical protein